MNEIGEILKEARIEKGYTLDDLQQITKIQKRYLQAIEDGNTDILPGRFYMRAFVKQYADIVGLDGEELLEGHLNQTSKEASEEFAEQVNAAPTRTQGKSEGVMSNLSEYLPTLLIFLLVAAIVVVIYFAWRQADSANDENSLITQDDTEQVAEPGIETDQNPDNADEADEGGDDADADADSDADNADEEDPEADEDEDTEEQTIEVTSNSGADTTYEITGTHPEEQTVTLTANGGDTWVSITAGSESDAGLLTNGQTMSVTFGSDVTQVDLVIGNAPVTDITLNDTAIQYAPEAAGIVRQDLTLQFSE